MIQGRLIKFDISSDEDSAQIDLHNLVMCRCLCQVAEEHALEGYQASFRDRHGCKQMLGSRKFEDGRYRAPCASISRNESNSAELGMVVDS